jgi:hypothetical protein
LAKRGTSPEETDTYLTRLFRLFDKDVTATLDRFADEELPVPEGSFAAELRAFYAAWRSELAA